MENNRELACNIVELFEDFLYEKNIVIPCSDDEEESERYSEDGEPLANLYGMEYWYLVDVVEAMLVNRKESK